MVLIVIFQDKHNLDQMNYNYITGLLKLILPKQLISLVTRLFGFFVQDVKSHSGVIFDPKNKFEGNNVLLSNTRVYRSKVGMFSYISSNSLISNTKIGRYSSIGNWVSTGIGRHPINFVSSHPLFHSGTVSESLGFTSYNLEREKFETHKILESGYYVEIGSDVWIGDRVLIMDGIKIGDGAIIGAGSIVNKDIEPYEVVAGVPARHLKYRFLKNEIEFLISLKWWEKDQEWIKKNANLFSDISNLKI